MIKLTRLDDKTMLAEISIWLNASHNRLATARNGIASPNGCDGSEKISFS